MSSAEEVASAAGWRRLSRFVTDHQHKREAPNVRERDLLPGMPGLRLARLIAVAASTVALLGVVLALLPGIPIANSAPTLPFGFVDNVIDNGLSEPTAMELAPDGRIFVAEQNGALRVIKNGSLLPAPFVTVTVSSSGERGLLGVTFDPNFASNHYVYVYYTATSPSTHNRVSRFTANGDVAVPGSEQAILDLNTLSGDASHNGGAIHFGLDGKLYIAVGDNGSGSNAQSMTTLKGKMLRINPDGSIPTDNPFYGTASGVNRAIWTLGLRNPFTFSVQPGTGRIFINDVGAMAFEEIDEGVAGSNYGWPATEGYTTVPSYRTPLFAYPHGPGGTSGCAITGGAFYNPASGQFPASYVGGYFFADFCNHWIRKYNPATDTASPFASGVGEPVDLKVGANGTLYYLDRTDGAVHAIRYSDSDSDGDGCGDQQELGADPVFGGDRDPNNFWDFFDTDTENNLNAGTALAGSVSIGDIVNVVMHFGRSGSPSIDPLSNAKGTNYHTRFDRTIEGPSAWNLGPPNGSIAAEDILFTVAQFGHHCT